MLQSINFIGASRHPLDGDGGDADALEHHKGPAYRDSTTIDRRGIDIYPGASDSGGRCIEHEPGDPDDDIIALLQRTGLRVSKTKLGAFFAGPTTGTTRVGDDNQKFSERPTSL